MRFLLIDRFTEWQPGKRARAVKNVALSEDFFDDHFPLSPVMPGVLILEGMAQLSGLLVEETVRRETGRNVKALLTIVERTKFRCSAYPGDRLEYLASVVSINEAGARMKVSASIEDRAAAESVLIFSLHEVDNPVLERKRADILSLWMKGIEIDE